MSCPTCHHQEPWHEDDCLTWKAVLAEVSAPPRPPPTCPTCNGERTVPVRALPGGPGSLARVPCPYCTPRPHSNLDDDADQQLEALRATVVAQAVRITTLTAELAAARLALTTRSTS